MKTVNIGLLFLVFLFSFFLSGCQVPIQLYPGPELPSSEVAILKFKYTNRVKELIIDGKDWEQMVSSDLPRDPIHRSFEFALLPGKHEISWEYHPQVMYNKDGKPYIIQGAGILNAKAGKKYRVYFNYKTNPNIPSGATKSFRDSLGYGVYTVAVTETDTGIGEEKFKLGSWYDLFITEDWIPNEEFTKWGKFASKQKLNDNKTIFSVPSRTTNTLPKGLVRSIIKYSDPEKSNAVVGSHTVHKGDTVYGIKIIAIRSDEVEFEKDGRQWTQRVNEPPSQDWQQAGLSNGLYKQTSKIADSSGRIELKADGAVGYIKRGNVYYNSEQYEKAISEYNKAIELDSDFAIAYYNRGHSYALLQRYEQAKKDLLKALELNPTIKPNIKKLSDTYQLGLQLD